MFARKNDRGKSQDFQITYIAQNQSSCNFGAGVGLNINLVRGGR